MKKLAQWAEEIAQEQNFKILKEIRRASYYDVAPGDLRTIILDGEFQGQPAVLKVYDDPRTGVEQENIVEFNKRNQGELIVAPKILAGETVSVNRGWFIAEHLPDDVVPFARPLPEEERAKFLELYLEYRRNLPETPWKKASLAESLSPADYHQYRISRWLNLASDREDAKILAGEEPVLEAAKFRLCFEKASELIRREFAGRKMIWGHGLFNPTKLFWSQSAKKYFLLGFNRMHLFPEGYELAFIVWSDWLIGADWNLPFEKWCAGVWDWLEKIKAIEDKLNLKNLDSLFKASLAERCLGTILADVTASAMPREEKLKRIDLLYNLLEELTQ